MQAWQPYNGNPNTVTGDLLVMRDFYSPQLNNRRDVMVWLPPTYASGDRHYPVIYMHDGQNLFDLYTSNSGEWEVDETMTALSSQGVEAIIVGLPNMREQRGTEYSPYPFRIPEGLQVEARGDAYVRFIAETVKPLIDAGFRTRTEAAATGIAGSSMGGLISLYGFVMYPHVFGLCGAFSTAYWFGDNALLATIQAHADGHGRVYHDIGMREGETVAGWFGISESDGHTVYLQGVRDLQAALIAKGYKPGDNLMYVEEKGAIHREHAWAARFPAAITFLLSEIRG